MEPKHSGLGIASFVLSIFTGIMLFALLAIAAVLWGTTSDEVDEKAPSSILLGLFFVAFGVLDLVALGLGIGGMCQRNRKKVFGVLGTVFSVAIALGTTLLVVLGNQE